MADWTTPAFARPRLPAPSALLPSRRVGATAGALAVALALAYLAARVTPLFALHDVQVSGAPARVQAEVEATLSHLDGTSLVALDGGEVIRRVEALPTVVSARYDRAFPHTLRLFVDPERPVAAAGHRRVRWLVSERGRVMRRATARDRRAYPGIPLPRTEALSPGEIVADPAVRAPLGALVHVPATFPVDVRAARVEAGRITLLLSTGAEVRLGAAVDLRSKIAAAASVLAALTPEERSRLAYLDASLPARVVAADKSQVAG